MVDISRARSIGINREPRFVTISTPELVWLAEKAQTHNVIVEVGCFIGRSTRALADNTNGIVYAVDPWFDEGSEVRGIYEPETRKQSETDEMYALFKQNVSDLLGKKVFVKRMPSIDAANLFLKEGIQVDMVFIDGCHDYEYVYKDITLWSKVIKPGGLLCGHDYADSGTTCYTPSVNRAVDEQVSDVQIFRGVAEGAPYDTCRIWWKVL